MARSRVGTSTRALGWRGVAGLVRSMAEIPKARVLPDPVLALPQMSRPARAAGITSDWIGKGSMMPWSDRAVQRSGDTPMVSNPTSSDIVNELLVLFGPGQ